MTTAGRFTVWVIVAVIAIMVVYLMVYPGWISLPRHTLTLCNRSTDRDTCRSCLTSTASFSPQAIK